MLKEIGGECLLFPLKFLEFAKNSKFWTRLNVSRKHPTSQLFFLRYNLLQHVFGWLSTLESHYLDMTHIYRIILKIGGFLRTRAKIVDHYFCYFLSLWIIPRLPQYEACFCRKSTHSNIYIYISNIKDTIVLDGKDKKMFKTTKYKYFLLASLKNLDNIVQNKTT